VIGLDGEWNPWITTVPRAVKAGALNVSATIIHRVPMKLDRVNLRTTLHLGTSILLFDVYGAPDHAIGGFLSLSPIGIDYDLGGHVRLVFDPGTFALPIPVLSNLPLYYEQFRVMIGIEFGA
jgi:hypothetical protein